MSIFIHDCIECQQNKHINQKIQTASIQTFSEIASYFNYRISMDTKGPINPPSNQNSYIHVIVDAFSHFVVAVPIKQNNAQNAVKNYSNLHFELEDNTKFYPTNPYTYFLQKFKNVFHFLDMIVNEKSKDYCATIIQNFTSYPATLPRGIIGYIEIPITQTTPLHYRVHDVTSLIHSVIHAYHPDTTTPIKQIHKQI